MTTRSGYATPKSVRAAAGEMEASVLQCRDLGHSWRPLTVSVENGKYHRRLRCSRCPTERVQVLSKRGVVEKNNYDYPEGYLITGLGRIVGEAKSALRLLSITRALEDK